jgi:cobalt-zinc-cadmium efflux system protein
MSHDHNHSIGNYNRAFAIGVVLNIVFVAIEITAGFFADSLALIADAGHNMSDVVSLLLAWGASILATKAATEKRTYGFRKATVMASLASSILLLVALGSIAWEAIGRFVHPEPVKGFTVIVVATIGVAVNGATALLFVKGQAHDLNVRGAFLHMAADAGVSLGVVVAGFLMLLKGWLWVDPMVTLVIVAVIFVGTWNLLRDSVNYAMDAVPKNMDIVSIKQYLMHLDNVSCIHDLHVWPMSTSEVALTVHMVIDDTQVDNKFLSEIQEHLHDHFDIEHATIQIETSTMANQCMLDKHHCV